MIALLHAVAISVIPSISAKLLDAILEMNKNAVSTDGDGEASPFDIKGKGEETSSCSRLLIRSTRENQ